MSMARTWATSRPDRRLLLVGQVEQAGDVPLGDDEGVAFRDGESVGERHGELALQADAVLLQATERAVVLVHDADSIPELSGRCRSSVPINERRDAQAF